MKAPDDLPPFSQRLRAAYDPAADPATAPPSAQVWAGIQARLQPVPPPPTRAFRAGVAGLAGLLVGVLLTWLWLTPGAPATSGARPLVAAAPAAVATAAPTVAVSPERQPVARRQPIHKVGQPVVAPVVALTPAVAPAAVAPLAPGAVALVLPTAEPVVPGTAALSVPTALVPLAHLEHTYQGLVADTSANSRTRRRAALLTQRLELTRLRARTDSLLLTLGEAAAPALPEAVAATDSVAPAKPLTSRWSVALTFAPERNFFHLQAPAADTLAALRRTHETGRGGYNAALLAEYRLTDRLSVAGGAGLSTYGAELRLTDRRTTVTVHYDTAVTHTTQNYQTITRAWAIRVVQDTVLTPIFNLSGQVVGYHSNLVPRNDTVWTNLINNYSATTTSRTVTPKVTKREEVSARILKPNYRFVTLPLLLRYRLTPGPRWWADVAVGAQVQLFLGGTQLTTLDGRTYQTESIGPRGGPFRPVNVALMGSLAVNYALTPRLSANLAPTIRWQAESVYKASTNLSQRPTATGVQLGLRYAF